MASASKRFKGSSPPTLFSLHEAILEKNRKEVKRLLFEESVDPNEGGFTFTSRGEDTDDVPRLEDVAPIHLTVIAKSLDLLVLLIESNADLNVTCGHPHELSALELAALCHEAELTKVLIEREARLPQKALFYVSSAKELAFKRLRKSIYGPKSWDVYRSNRKTGNFIHYLCQKGVFTERTIMNLLDFGLKINDRTDKRETPLHIVLGNKWKSNEEGVDILLRHGADITLRDEDDNTPLMVALSHPYCSLETLKKLTPSGLLLQAKNSKGYNALSLNLRYTSASEAILFMEFLLKQGADIHQKLDNENNLFISASESIEPEPKVKYLLKMGLKPTFDVIRVIIECRFEKLLKLFLSKHRDLDLTQYLPLIFHLILINFKEKKLLPLVKHLIEDYGVDANSRGDRNCTLICSLVKSKRCRRCSQYLTDLLQYLLSKGWKPQVDDVKEALTVGGLKVLSFLFDHLNEWDLKQEIPNALVFLVKKEMDNKRVLSPKEKEEEAQLLLSLIKRLIEDFSFDPNYCDESDSFLIELIRNNGRHAIPCLDFMLASNGLDVNVLTKGETPLSVAVEKGYYKLAQKLIHNFADSSKVKLRVNFVSKGFSSLFKLLYYSGYIFGCELVFEGRKKEEIKWFTEWLKNKQKTVFPLKRIAGNVVRRVYGKGVDDILQEIEFPEEVANILLLKKIESKDDNEDASQASSSSSEYSSEEHDEEDDDDGEERLWAVDSESDSDLYI